MNVVGDKCSKSWRNASSHQREAGNEMVLDLESGLSIRDLRLDNFY